MYMSRNTTCTYVHCIYSIFYTQVYCTEYNIIYDTSIRHMMCLCCVDIIERTGNDFILFFSQSVISKQISTVTITDRFSLTTHVVDSFMAVPKIKPLSVQTILIFLHVRFRHRSSALFPLSCGRCIRLIRH